MVVKTAVGSPDEGPKRKGYGNTEGDKKDLKNKNNKNNDYHSISNRYEPKNPHGSKGKEDSDYENFKKDYIRKRSDANGKGYHGYQAPDGSWHGHPLSESAIKAHHKWSKMTRDQQKKHAEDTKKRSEMTRKQPDKQHPHENPGSPKPKDWDHPKPTTPSNRLQDELKKKSSSVKVVKNKIKKPEDKEKANKLKKTASRSKISIRMKKKKAK